jgi:phosphoribosylamine-glycine ligase
MGLVTHVASSPGNFPGIPLADHFYPVDTTSITEVVSLAKKLRIKGVVTAGTDVAIPAIGAVVDELGLEGPKGATAEIITYKDRFRAFQHAHGLCAPQYLMVDSCKDLSQVAERLSAPFIVKPVDSSGSRGINIVSEITQNDIECAFIEAKKHSKSGRICFEERLQGVEVGGNALLLDGKIIFISISQKFMDGFVVRGHAYPTALSKKQQLIVQEEILKTCCALEYHTGPLNFDIMVRENDAVIIEMGARLGGNGLTELIHEAYKYDIQMDILNLSIGKMPVGAPVEKFTSCGAYVFGSKIGGTLESMPSYDQISKAVPEVTKIISATETGDTVYPFTDNSRQLGCVLFRMSNRSWEDISENINAALHSALVIS